MPFATSPQPAKRAAIIEPQTLFVPYLVSTLRRTGLNVVRAAPQIHARRLQRLAPDVLLVGVDDFPAPLHVVRRLRRLLPSARIVVYTHSPDQTWRMLACAVGADAVVGPADDERELLDACNAPSAVISG